MYSVLIVDDDHAIVEFLSLAFEDEGFTVRYAYNGLDALENVNFARPDVVVTDIAMPGLDGVTLARRLCSQNIPVVVVSAAMRAPEIPGVPFVPKPFDLDHLLAITTTILNEDGGNG